jgi:putative FmdB family regulatory protein
MTYEYQCRACGHTWEEEQKITDPPSKKCPECGQQDTAMRLISKSAFILNGPGWYKSGGY